MTAFNKMTNDNIGSVANGEKSFVNAFKKARHDKT